MRATPPNPSHQKHPFYMGWRNSIQNKLILTFLLIFAVVFAANLYSYYNSNKLSASINNLFQRQIPATHSIEQVHVALEAASSSLHLALAAEYTAELQEVRDTKAEFNKASREYEMYTTALILGSDSEAFKKASEGAIYAEWKKQGLDKASVILALPADQATIVKDAKGYFWDKYQQYSLQTFALKEKLLLTGKTLPPTELAAAQEQLQVLVRRVEAQKQQIVLLMVKLVEASGNEANKQVVAQQQLIASTQFVNTLSSLLAVGFAIILSVVFSQRILVKPLKKLNKVAIEFSEGRLDNRVAVSSKDELGQLATSFNTMASKLQELYTDLEQKVKDRSQALNNKVQELAEAKAKDDAILDSVGDGMIVTDSKGTILLVNTIAANILELGSDTRQLIGQPIAKCQLQDESGAQLAFKDMPSQIVMQTGQKIVKEVKIAKKDGHSNSLNINAMPIFRAGKITGVIQLIRDITHEKEVDRMKTEFISLASHQLRTPLSAIKWFSEMLVSGDAGKLEEAQLEFAKNIADSAERMVALVNALLNISRIESGRIMIDPKPTDLRELVSGIINDLKGKTAEKQQSLVVSVHQDLPKINLDPRLIGQVYLNLLTNAIKYTPKGGEISVFISKKDDQVVSQVTDNGYGIPKDQQPRLFQKFFRASNAVKVETDGTGLGLYLIKSVVESSGGKIWFESEEGKGTTFWFSIPLSGMKAKEGEVTLGV
ncbi:MAG TPA: ATP-binding protein [Candidatus Saccharimonadales bacterium]